MLQAKANIRTHCQPQRSGVARGARQPCPPPTFGECFISPINLRYFSV